MENHLITLLSELVQINSINRTLSGGPGEREIAEFIARRLNTRKLDAAIQDVGPGQRNVTTIIAGKDRRCSLLLNAHLDTVGIDGMDQPFILKREGDRLYGRGTYDMKGSIAIMLLLADYFTRQKPPIDIFLTFVSDEEDKSTGMEYLVGKWLPQVSPAPVGGIFLEPTEEDIGVSHRGFTWYELAVSGKAAHGSRPEQGIDAILPLRSAMEELSKIQTELQSRHPDPLLGHASIHCSVIKGGSELSMIPSRSCLQWERRTLPGESSRDLAGELERILQAVNNHPGGHTVAGRALFVRPPYRVAEGAEIIKRMREVTPQSKLVGLSFWADSALAGAKGIPSILFGPTGHGAHAVDEWVSLKSILNVYEILKKLILNFE
ncbi:MAG: M20/M25/M40 family metallo-hydrolase [Desulfobacteraceae bacterium]|jgi:acetylornithine deacetylase|nr:M20/M25/M40 family metallo-hydrolase [Desulfobacteraceae bacterium]